MSSQDNEKGWVLHSLAQARRFGPMTEDDLRGYFRAGMVKSVDRLTAPGDYVMRSAAEVATMLGETVPAGPPPPDLEAQPTPLPSMAAGVASDPVADALAARKAAALNIDVAAMMAANSRERERRSGWVVPVIAVVVLIVMLFVALNMLRRMAPTAGPPATSFEKVPSSGTANDSTPGVPAATAPIAGAARSVPMPGTKPVASGASPDDAEFNLRMSQAQALQNASNWTGLAEHSRQWAQVQPQRNEPLQFLGIAYSSLGQNQLAIDTLLTILARDPEHAGAQALLADVYLQAQRWNDAAPLYKKLVAASPQDSRLWNNYGAALNGSGQQAQAVAALETAVKLDPDFKQAWTNLGNVYKAMGDSARASAAFANAR